MYCPRGDDVNGGLLARWSHEVFVILPGGFEVGLGYLFNSHASSWPKLVFDKLADEVGPGHWRGCPVHAESDPLEIGAVLVDIEGKPCMGSSI